LASAKECVTTHPPKCMAPTMDGAQALVFHSTYTDAIPEWHFSTVHAVAGDLQAGWLAVISVIQSCPQVVEPLPCCDSWTWDE